jgi:hypothetical protein
MVETFFRGQTVPSVYYSLRETVFSNISSTLLLVDFMLVASGGVLIFRKDFIAIYLIYIFTYMDKNMFTTLYKSIVRPHLEYGSNIWSVMYKKEAIQIESVQRRATKLVKNIQHLSYSDLMLVASGGVLIFRKDFIAIYLIYIVNNSKRFYHVRS